MIYSNASNNFNAKKVSIIDFILLVNIHFLVKLHKKNGGLKVSEVNVTVLEKLSAMKSDEIFYKEYYEARKTPAKLKKFLSNLNPDDVKKRHLIVPEISPELIPHVMDDQEYFDKHDQQSVFFSQHNRYTPAFLHKHVFFEIVYVLSGRCVQAIGLDTHQFHEGDFIFIAPDTFHTMEVFDDNSIIINILLRRSTFHDMFAPLTRGNDLLSEFFSSGLYSSNQFQYMVFHSEKDKFLKEELLKMCAEWMNPDKYTDQILIGILTMVFAYLMRDYSTALETSVSPHSTMPDDFLIMNYIQENLKDISLSDIAKHFNFSVSYCSRMIKSSTGVSFNEWKRTLRLRRAEHLLLSSNYTIAQISDSVGYANPESFIRIFKKEFHLSPSEYRKSKNRTLYLDAVAKVGG